MNENNLFRFATKELSQDAFLCWCLNFYNYDSSFRKLSKNILTKILPDKVVNDIKEIKIIRQFLHIDILLVITLNTEKQVIVIIEDKIESEINKKSQKDLYLTKLFNCDKEKLNKYNIVDLNRNNVYAVLLCTGINRIKKINELKENVSKKISNELILFDINNLYDILKNYKDKSDIIKSFFKHLEYTLMINDKLNTTENIRNQKFISINKTIFSKAYHCYNCFIHLIDEDKEKYTERSCPTGGGVHLKELQKHLENIFKSGENKERTKIVVDVVRFYNFKDFRNYFEDEEKNIWIEEFPRKQNEKYSNRIKKIRYVFLFGRTLDSFGKDNFVFYGLYRFDKFDTKNGNECNIWKKCELDDNITLDKDELIRKIKKIENT